MRKQFDIQYRPQIESGEYKVETRSGLPARIICWDRKTKDMEILALVYDEQIDEDNEDLAEVALNGRMFPRGKDHDYDLFIVTPEEELSEFEKGLVKFYRTRGEIQPDKDGAFNRHEVDELLHKVASELLAIARTELVKQGYVIEKKAFHDAVKKVSPEIMKEVSENVDMQMALRTEYEKGREDALKDLPRWKKYPHNAGREPLVNGILQKDGSYKWRLYLDGYKIEISDLTKLPGFKED